MEYVPLEQMLDKTGYSTYKLVVLAFRRALEIAEGQPKLIEVSGPMKPSLIALLEIAQGKVWIKGLKVS